jgi:hypothetical protein
MSGKGCAMKTIIRWLCIFVVTASTALGLVQDSVYFKNLVFHANGSLCTHRPAASSFVAYLNNDRSRILLETSPRWNVAAEPNISGNCSFSATRKMLLAR